MTADDKILVLGAAGLVGSACVKTLGGKGFTNVIACTRRELDLTRQDDVLNYFEKVQPDYVLLAAGKVGGIVANSSYAWDFAYTNLIMAVNTLEAARQIRPKKVLLFGSTCMYPRMAEQPIQESSLLTGSLEATSQWYAVAKIAGLKLGQALRRQHGLSVICATPTGLYGPNDNFHPQHSHVLAGLLRRFHDAKALEQPSIQVWGSGSPRREFLYVDDLAEALLVLLESYDEEEPINIGTGADLPISELVTTIAEVVGYEGQILYDTSKPDGTPRKQTDSSRMFGLGWSPRTPLREGIEATYRWFLANLPEGVVPA